MFRCRLFLALRRLSPIILAGEGPCSFAGFLWCGGVALCLRTLFPLFSFSCLSFGLSLLGRGDAIFGSRWRGVVVRVLLRALVWLTASVCSSLSFRCWVCAFCDGFGGPFSSGRGLSSSPSGAWVVRVRGGRGWGWAGVVSLVGVLPLFLLVALWVVTLARDPRTSGGWLRINTVVDPSCAW